MQSLNVCSNYRFYVWFCAVLCCWEPQIQKAIAESYAEYMAGRSYVYNVARSLDLSSYGNGLDADGVKLYCAPMAKRVADRAMQVLGGNGYTGLYQVERLWRDAKLWK